jgi:hypothetical protein
VASQPNQKLRNRKKKKKKKNSIRETQTASNSKTSDGALGILTSLQARGPEWEGLTDNF